MGFIVEDTCNFTQAVVLQSTLHMQRVFSLLTMRATSPKQWCYRAHCTCSGCFRCWRCVVKFVDDTLRVSQQIAVFAQKYYLRSHLDLCLCMYVRRPPKSRPLEYRWVRCHIPTPLPKSVRPQNYGSWTIMFHGSWAAMTHGQLWHMNSYDSWTGLTHEQFNYCSWAVMTHEHIGFVNNYGSRTVINHGQWWVMSNYHSRTVMTHEQLWLMNNNDLIQSYHPCYIVIFHDT